MSTKLSSSRCEIARVLSVCSVSLLRILSRIRPKHICKKHQAKIRVVLKLIVCQQLWLRELLLRCSSRTGVKSNLPGVT